MWKASVAILLVTTHVVSINLDSNSCLPFPSAPNSTLATYHSCTLLLSQMNFMHINSGRYVWNGLLSGIGESSLRSILEFLSKFCWSGQWVQVSKRVVDYEIIRTSKVYVKVVLLLFRKLLVYAVAIQLRRINLIRFPVRLTGRIIMNIEYWPRVCTNYIAVSCRFTVKLPILEKPAQ